MGWHVQSIYFLSPRWAAEDARRWLADHGYKPIKRMHRVGTEMRWRIKSPAGMSKFRTITLPNGAHIVRGFKA